MNVREARYGYRVRGEQGPLQREDRATKDGTAAWTSLPTERKLALYGAFHRVVREWPRERYTAREALDSEVGFHLVNAHAFYLGQLRPALVALASRRDQAEVVVPDQEPQEVSALVGLRSWADVD